jgi:hypothetical protein
MLCDCPNSLPERAFTTIIAFGWEDAPSSGVAECSNCGRTLAFETVAVDADLDRRIVAVSALPSGTLARVEIALAPLGEPRRPIWVPLWRFDTPEQHASVERDLNALLEPGGPIEWVLDSWNVAKQVLRIVRVSEENREAIETLAAREVASSEWEPIFQKYSGP